jgi:hypothetical protein
MPYSYAVYTGNGVTTQFTVPFPYIRREHVVVSLDYVSTTFTWINNTTVEVSPAPTNGERVEVRRVTPVNNPLVDFTDGSTLVAADLDINALQQTYINQEQDDQIQQGIYVDPQGNLTAGNQVLKDLLDPVDPQDAATKNYTDTRDALKVSKAGDTMTGPLAMSGQKITGLGDPTNAQDAVTKTWVETATSAPLVQFRSIFYGALATDPAVDPYGNARTEGDLYFNSTLDQMRVFNGTSWQEASADATITRFKFTAAGGETSLSGNDDDSQSLTYNVGLEMVYINGALMTRGVDYVATTGSSITGLVALSAADLVEVVAFSQIDAIGSIPSANSTFLQSGTGAVQRTVDSKLKDVVSVKDFGAVGNGVADDTAAIQAAIDHAESLGRGAIYFPASIYRVSSTLTVQGDNITLRGDGINSVITRNNASYGSTLVVSAADPTASTIFDVTIADIKFNSTVAMTAGAHLEIVEAAYFTLENLSIQNGFIGLHLRGLRASNINNIHIRSGQLYGSVQAGSRFCLIQDSPRDIPFAENVEVLMSNFNFTTNGLDAYIEHGLEIQEADGFWFDNGHIRGASVSNAFLNAASTPQLLGLLFNNVWFDGATQRCLLMDNSTGNYAGFYTFTGCLFTGGSTHGVHIVTGATMDTATFSGCQTWSIDAQIAWNIAAGNNIVIDGCSWKTLNTANAAASSAVSIASGVGAVTISGGSIKDSPNLDYGFVNNGTTQLTVTGVSFQDFAASGRPILLVNPATTRFASSGCTTDQETGYITGNQQFGEVLNLVTDAATFVAIGEVLGAVIVVTEKFNQTYGGIFSAETSGTASVGLFSGHANFAVTTGVLTGTTGTAGRITASITDSGSLYFENRTGVTRSLVWRIISRDLL